jgi:hypothetical protein
MHLLHSNGIITLLLLGLATTSAAQSVTDPHSALPARYAEEASVPKIALVIGNRNYQDSAVAEVMNGDDDAAAIADRLSQLGFDTVVREDATYAEMVTELQYLKRTVVRRYVEQAIRPVILIYFSGHGFNEQGRAYIAGVDVNPIHLLASSMALETALNALARDSVLLIFLDACRSDADNQSGKDTATPTRWSGPGVGNPDSNFQAAVHSYGSDTQDSLQIRKYLVAYAALRIGDAAHQAMHTGDKNSPYTVGLLKFIGFGQDLSDELGLTAQYVYDHTLHTQEPTSEGYPGHLFLFLTKEQKKLIFHAWGSAVRDGSVSEVEDFVSRYPDSPYTIAAFQWLRDQREQARSAGVQNGSN